MFDFFDWHFVLSWFLTSQPIKGQSALHFFFIKFLKLSDVFNLLDFKPKDVLKIFSFSVLFEYYGVNFKEIARFEISKAFKCS